MNELSQYCQCPTLTKHLIVDIISLYQANHREDTLNHVLNVADEAVMLAHRFNLNKNICYEAALLHDISAILTSQQMQDIAKKYKLYIYDAEKHYPFLLHQRISALMGKHYFHIDEPLLLKAVEHHTTLCKEPDDYMMAIFLADKIAWDQIGKPPHLDVIQEGLKHSLSVACSDYIDYVFKENRILYPHDWLIDARNYFNQNKSNSHL